MKNAIVIFTLLTLLSACNKEKTEITETIDFISTGVLDGTISNFNPPVFNDYFSGSQTGSYH